MVEDSLSSLVADRFAEVEAAERLTHIGRLSARAWELGPEGMRAAGFLLPPALHTSLSDHAARVRADEGQAAPFLSALRAALGFDDFFVAFVQSLEVWTSAHRSPAPASPTSDPGLQPGRLLGGFEILDRLGEGGMGAVYRARQPSLDRLVAIKVLHAHLAQDAQKVERFREEARAVAKLSHPNVVQILDTRSESEAGPHYIVLEYVDGPSLDGILEERGRLPEADALRVALHIASALECAERHGYVHRDVKPANVLLNAEGIAKLSDLGLARQVETETRKTTAGMILGTPHYMAPEQALDESAIDIRADLYSLGVTLFHMVTGALPFKGRTAISVITQHTNCELPNPNGFVEGVEVGEPVQRLVRALAARDPAERYPSAAEAILALEQALAGETPNEPSPLAGSPTPPPAPSKSSYYTREGILLTGQPKHALFPEAAPEAPEGGDAEGSADVADAIRRSLQAEWATVARTHLVSTTGPAPDVPDPRPSKSEAGQLLLSDDTQRAYQIKRRLGQGTQGVVYEVEVMGLREFLGFRRPVQHAVMKRATEAGAIEQERLIYSQIDYRMVKLLDHGRSKSGRPYIVLERLRGTPFDRYRGPKRSRVRTDPATATDLFVNLLERLKGLHFRRKLPLVLCDIKPANIMIRMPTAEEGLSEEEYVERLIEGRYEPVFVDLGCAQHRDILREAKGRLRGLIGSPILLPPESIPTFDPAGEFAPGIYGPQTDVYALALTYYEWISGHRPYQHLESEWTTSPDPLLALFELKRARVLPFAEEPLKAVLGGRAGPVIEVLHAGTDPDPRRRATTNKLLETCRRAFELEHRPRPKKPYAFDDPENRLSYRQRFFPPLHLEHNPYRKAERVEPE